MNGWQKLPRLAGFSELNRGTPCGIESVPVGVPGFIRMILSYFFIFTRFTLWYKELDPNKNIVTHSHVNYSSIMILIVCVRPQRKLQHQLIALALKIAAAIHVVIVVAVVVVVVVVVIDIVLFIVVDASEMYLKAFRFGILTSWR